MLEGAKIYTKFSRRKIDDAHSRTLRVLAKNQGRHRGQKEAR